MRLGRLLLDHERDLEPEQKRKLRRERAALRGTLRRFQTGELSDIPPVPDEHEAWARDWLERRERRQLRWKIRSEELRGVIARELDELGEQHGLEREELIALVTSAVGDQVDRWADWSWAGPFWGGIAEVLSDLGIEALESWIAAEVEAVLERRGA